MSPVKYLLLNELGLLAFLSIALDEIGKEEKFQYDEDDEEFDEDDKPQRLPYRHMFEAIIIQVEKPVKKTCLFHACALRFRCPIDKQQIVFANIGKKTFGWSFF